MPLTISKAVGVPVRIWLNQPKRGVEMIEIHPHDHPELCVNKALTDFRDARDGDGPDNKVDFHLTMASGLTSFDAHEEAPMEPQEAFCPSKCALVLEGAVFGDAARVKASVTEFVDLLLRELQVREAFASIGGETLHLMAA